jgi:hypothetical protein
VLNLKEAKGEGILGEGTAAAEYAHCGGAAGMLSDLLILCEYCDEYVSGVIFGT